MAEFVGLFHVYRDNQGLWRWRLLSTEGLRTLAISGESYKTPEDCETVVKFIKESAANVPVIIQPRKTAQDTPE